MAIYTDRFTGSTKPYRIEEFSQTIRELLGETASEA
jgi:hypothetical protein